MTRTPRTPARAETVGSLLRPPALKRAVEAFYAEGHSAALEEEREQDHTELRAAEDLAIREAVQRQIDCGLDVVTDGVEGLDRALQRSRAQQGSDRLRARRRPGCAHHPSKGCRQRSPGNLA